MAGPLETPCPECGKPLQLETEWKRANILRCAKHGLYACMDTGQLTKVIVAKPKPKAPIPVENDVTDEVKKGLPKELLTKLEEVEKVQKVKILEVDGLAGNAAGGVKTDGTIYVLPSTKGNHATVGEEIMHLHRWTSGYPKVTPLQPAFAAGYAGAIKLISGLFEEFEFFPFLKGLNLSPHAAVDNVMANTARELKLLKEGVKSDGATDYWRATLCGLFAQASLTSEKNGPLVLKLFEDDVFAPYAAIGKLICEEISTAAGKDQDATKEHMERAVFTHLKLPKDAVEVKPVFEKK
jgi:hypothetical protein